jgi:hypothetical protein
MCKHSQRCCIVLTGSWGENVPHGRLPPVLSCIVLLSLDGRRGFATKAVCTGKSVMTQSANNTLAPTFNSRSSLPRLFQQKQKNSICIQQSSSNSSRNYSTSITNCGGVHKGIVVVSETHSADIGINTASSCDGPVCFMPELVAGSASISLT